MGNTVAPCMCRKAAGTAAVTTRGRRPKSFVVTEAPAAAAPGAAPRRLAVTPRGQQRDDVEQQQDETTRAGPGRSRARARARAGGVSWAAGGVGADDAVGKKASAAAAVTVKIVLRRKDAEALVARLNAQSARERKARMAELKGEFRAGDDCVGGASPAPCRDAWKPRLAPIKEN